MCFEVKENLYYCIKRDEALLEYMLFRNKIFIILVERSNLIGIKIIPISLQRLRPERVIDFYGILSRHSVAFSCKYRTYI